MLSVQALVSVQMAEYMLVLGEGRSSSRALKYSAWISWVISLRSHQLTSLQVKIVKPCMEPVRYSVYCRTMAESAPQETRKGVSTSQAV